MTLKGTLANQRVNEKFSNKQKAVQSIQLRVTSATDENHEIVCPITKLVLLVENDSPTENDGTKGKTTE